MIHNAVQKAYDRFNTCEWNRIYIALDIHGTVANPDYTDVSTKLYNNAVEPLQVISNLPEVSIILFSCCYPTDYAKYYSLFEKHNILIQDFNKNTEVHNTETGCFDNKFYFNLMIDDKAGFEPWMWPSVRDAFVNAREFNPRVQKLYGHRIPGPAGGLCAPLREIYEGGLYGGPVKRLDPMPPLDTYKDM